jgi:hypothetical protein
MILHDEKTCRSLKFSTEKMPDELRILYENIKNEIKVDFSV